MACSSLLLDPPLGRTQLLANLEETLTQGGEKFELFANRWQPGQVTPNGYTYIERFWLDGTTPVWVFGTGSIRIEKRIWMQPGANTTYVRYTLLEANKPVELGIKVLANHRDHHARSGADLSIKSEPVEHGLRVAMPDDGSLFYILSAQAIVQPQETLHENLYLQTEAERGVGAYDTNLLAGVFHAVLKPGDITRTSLPAQIS